MNWDEKLAQIGKQPGNKTARRPLWNSSNYPYSLKRLRKLKPKCLYKNCKSNCSPIQKKVIRFKVPVIHHQPLVAPLPKRKQLVSGRSVYWRMAGSAFIRMLTFNRASSSDPPQSFHDRSMSWKVWSVERHDQQKGKHNCERGEYIHRCIGFGCSFIQRSSKPVQDAAFVMFGACTQAHSMEPNCA